jgi:hypothetical protein
MMIGLILTLSGWGLRRDLPGSYWAGSRNALLRADVSFVGDAVVSFATRRSRPPVRHEVLPGPRRTGGRVDVCGLGYCCWLSKGDEMSWGASSGRALSSRTECRNARPDQATSAETSTTKGSTRVRRSGPFSFVNLSSTLSLISSGHGCSPWGGLRCLARFRPIRADRGAERPTILKLPCIGRPTTTIVGWVIGPTTAAHTTSIEERFLTFNQILCGS